MVCAWNYWMVLARHPKGGIWQALATIQAGPCRPLHVHSFLYPQKLHRSITVGQSSSQHAMTAQGTFEKAMR
jgi:hypothetical protein